MKTKELKELREAADRLIYLRKNEDFYKKECAICNVFIEEWEDWKKNDLCFECLREWFKIATPEIVSELVIEQIQSNFADNEQIELGGEKVCRD